MHRLGTSPAPKPTAASVTTNLLRERVRQIEAKALRKMRHAVRRRKLEAFLDWSVREQRREITVGP